jgi:hypothetical protein
LILGRFWAYMTVDYIYEYMTWHEISDALQFVGRYDEPKIPHYKRYKSMMDWIGGGDEREKLAKVHGKFKDMVT